MSRPQITYGMYTMCLIQKDDKVLLINRPDKLGFPGYLGPGGKWSFLRAFQKVLCVRFLRRQD